MKASVELKNKVKNAIIDTKLKVVVYYFKKQVRQRTFKGEFRFNQDYDFDIPMKAGDKINKYLVVGKSFRALNFFKQNENDVISPIATYYFHNDGFMTVRFRLNLEEKK